MAEVSVIIVTWNAEKFIKQCLDSVFCQPVNGLEVIVFDNGSKDATLKILEEYNERICLIRGEENRGFCFANNQALAKASGEFILILNSDVVLGDGYLLRLLKFFKTNSKCGMVQGKFLRIDEKTIDGLGLRLDPLWRLFNVAEGKKDSPDFNKPLEIFGPCAAAALYRAKLVKDISENGEFFDESFFFLVEDFDVAWRARNQGWEGRYVPEAVCYHYRGSSAHRSEFRQYLSLRNRYYLIIKNADFNLAFVVRSFVALFLYDLPRLFFLLLVNRPALKALGDLRECYPELLKKRRWLKRKKIGKS